MAIIIGNIALVVLGYNGKNFAGFARQETVRTVQGELEHALSTVLRREVSTVCAGRTDAGVHARMQAVSFECTPDEISNPRKLKRSLDALTGEDIIVRGIMAAPDGFSARFDADSRTYRYRIAQTRPIFGRDFVWHVPQELDLDAMHLALPYLLGEHDFSSFCTTASAKELRAKGLSLNREVQSIEIFTENNLCEEHLVIEVVGNAFLHSMVRTIVGTLVDIGTGLYEPDRMATILAAADRATAGPTAPAHGLTLHEVLYKNLDLEVCC